MIGIRVGQELEEKSQDHVIDIKANMSGEHSIKIAKWAKITNDEKTVMIAIHRLETEPDIMIEPRIVRIPDIDQALHVEKELSANTMIDIIEITSSAGSIMIGETQATIASIVSPRNIAVRKISRLVKEGRRNTALLLPTPPRQNPQKKIWIIISTR